MTVLKPLANGALILWGRKKIQKSFFLLGMNLIKTDFVTFRNWFTRGL